MQTSSSKIRWNNYNPMEQGSPCFSSTGHPLCLVHGRTWFFGQVICMVGPTYLIVWIICMRTHVKKHRQIASITTPWVWFQSYSYVVWRREWMIAPHRKRVDRRDSRACDKKRKEGNESPTLKRCRKDGRWGMW